MEKGERRKSPRLQKRVMVRINERSGMLLDVSSMGLRVSTSMIPVTRNVQISFRAGGEEVELDGEIIWINKKYSVQNLKEMGIAIYDQPEGYKLFLQKLSH